MRKRFVVAMLAVYVSVCGLSSQGASAVSQNVVLSQLQLGSAISASNEFIELYNNADTDTEITNWCLYYAAASSTQIGSKLGCFTPQNDSLHFYLPSHSFAFVISTALSISQPTLGSDLKFSATLAATGGHVRIIDGSNNEVDKVGWGTTAMSPETLFTMTAPIGNVIQRKLSLIPYVLQDTDDNSVDFELVSPRTEYSYGAIYERQDLCKNIADIQDELPLDYSVDEQDNCIPPPIDVCTNIEGLQIDMPLGYALDEAGLCQQDSCINITGLQTVVPAGKELDVENNCVDHDFCVNIPEVQDTIPTGYGVNLSEECFLNFLPIKVNELLANPVGSDNGNEFIELYNPNPSAVSLELYQLRVGVDAPKLYPFPQGSEVPSNGYAVFSDADIGFTLVNTNGQVAIVTTDGQLVDESPVYSNAGDGQAWAVVGGAWQYTDQPTPGSSNLPSTFVFDDETAAADLKPCAPNQYRHPETNRCRLLVTAGSTLIPCKDGQYRSEITNRCRNIAGDVLGACAANQYRNPETNRCRLIASTDGDLKPCSDNQERSPDTNRCRNKVASTIPEAAFAVEPIADSAGAVWGWWALGGVGLVAVGYAAWEWREEVLRLVRRFGSFFHSGK
jgi:hypothetical protein